MKTSAKNDPRNRFPCCRPTSLLAFLFRFHRTVASLWVVVHHLGARMTLTAAPHTSVAIDNAAFGDFSLTGENWLTTTDHRKVGGLLASASPFSSGSSALPFSASSPGVYDDSVRGTLPASGFLGSSFEGGWSFTRLWTAVENGLPVLRHRSAVSRSGHHRRSPPDRLEPDGLPPSAGLRPLGLRERNCAVHRRIHRGRRTAAVVDDHAPR